MDCKVFNKCTQWVTGYKLGVLSQINFALEISYCYFKHVFIKATNYLLNIPQ